MFMASFHQRTAFRGQKRVRSCPVLAGHGRPAFTALPASTVAVLPVGAIEQHGPHLPVYVDSCINQELLDRALATAPADLDVVALPLQAVGKSNEHLAFPERCRCPTQRSPHCCSIWGQRGARVCGG
jgi:hypothetical protein